MGYSCRAFAAYADPTALDENTFAQLVAGANKISPRIGLHLCLAGVSWFDPLRQPLIASSNLAQFQANIHVVHGLGSEQDFFGACSKAAGQRSKLRIQHWNAFEQRCGPKPKTGILLLVLVVTRAPCSCGRSANRLQPCSRQYGEQRETHVRIADLVRVQ